MYASKCSNSSSNAWVLDTDTSSNIFLSLQVLANKRRLRPNEVTLKLGNGVSVAAKAMGSTSIDFFDHILLLDDVLYVPNAYRNIISISSLTRKGYKFLFKIDICNIYFGSNIIGYMVYIMLIINPITKSLK